MMTKHAGIFAVTMSCLLLGGCGFDDAVTGPMRNDPISLDAGAAERANVELDMGAGQLIIGGGATKLVDGHFEYNVDAWKPLVTSSINGSSATVTIKQPSGMRGGKKHYEWDLQLSDRLLTDLTINCGAGQAKLDLGSLLLRSLAVHMGAGQVQLDLRGQPKHDYDVKIEGGVGQADIRLPQGVGIWAEAHGGIGSVNVTGLQKNGDHWENDLYNKAKVTVKVQVNGGIGEIRITE
jgi:uncharacterized protein DUF2154/cell wall-active antibiotic response 4TMS protein YvqF